MLVGFVLIGMGAEKKESDEQKGLFNLVGFALVLVTTVVLAGIVVARSLGGDG